MAPKMHPADIADIEKIATATHFTAHLRTGPHDRVTKTARTLGEAIKVADAMGKTPGGKSAMIYAITPDNMTVHVPASMIAKARKEAAQTRGRAAVEALGRVVEGIVAENPKAFGKAVTAPRSATRKAKAARPTGRRAQIAENASRGILPPVPDFSAPSHARYRKKLAEIVTMVEAGDIEGLRAFPINPYSSSPKAMARYRDLAVIAITAQSHN